MGVIRYECGEPFEQAFVEFTDAWTRLEVKRAIEDKGDEYIELLSHKIVAVNLPTLTGIHITKPQDFTADNLDNCDTRLVKWIGAVPMKVLQDITDMGEALRDRLFATPDEMAITPVP